MQPPKLLMFADFGIDVDVLNFYRQALVGREWVRRYIKIQGMIIIDIKRKRKDKDRKKRKEKEYEWTSEVPIVEKSEVPSPMINFVADVVEIGWGTNIYTFITSLIAPVGTSANLTKSVMSTVKAT